MSFDAPLLRIRAAVRILKGEFQMKQYQKPKVNYENFALAEHIALCDYKLNSDDANTCSIEKDRYDGDGIELTGAFTKLTTVGGPCTMPYDEIYCYTNGAGMPKIFQS